MTAAERIRLNGFRVSLRTRGIEVRGTTGHMGVLALRGHGQPDEGQYLPGREVADEIELALLREDITRSGLEIGIGTTLVTADGSGDYRVKEIGTRDSIVARFICEFSPR